jgi:hypothetical protein
MYTVDYFIDKFEAIPEPLWCVDNQLNDRGQSCAFGHCNPEFNKGVRGEEYSAFFKLSISAEKIIDPGIHLRGYLTNGLLAEINNGNYSNYQQPTPKQRILAALYDIKKLQSKDTEQQPKERIVYVSVPVSITEQAKDLITN